jgi:hypothetical protein
LRKLVLEDGLVDYMPPGHTDLLDQVQIAPRGCLTLGHLWGHMKDGGMDQKKSFIVALRITRSGRCKS